MSSVSRNSKYVLYYSIILIVVACCSQDDTETNRIGQFKEQIGYLNYSSGSFSTLQYKKDHVTKLTLA